MVNLKGRNLLTLLDYTPREIEYLLDLSRDLKRAKYAGTGCLASSVKPFVVAVAVDAAKSGGSVDISQSDGMAFRWIAWVILTAIAIVMVMWYAHRIHKNPQKSVVFETMEEDKVFFLGEKQEEYKFNGRRIASLCVFLGTFIIMVIYMVKHETI